jgi:subtilisin family serine protease
MRVLIQLRPPAEIVEAVIAAAAGAPGAPPAPAPEDIAGRLPGVALDPRFPPLPVPRPLAADGGHPVSLDQPTVYSLEPAEAGVLVRGEIADDQAASRLALLLGSRPDVTGVFSDPVIETCLTCGDSSAVGDWKDVADNLRVAALTGGGYTGAGVAMAVVDTGVSLAHLEDQLGEPPTLDATRSWTPAGVSTRPGAHPVDHGTMCAFDGLIAAPRATLLDVAVLLSRREGSTVLEGLLSDAVAAYAHLRTVLDAMPAEQRALVVSNSWGSFSPNWDFPPGHPGNYSDNRAHPFNIIVGSLEQAGADILFAAGNCGRDCPDGRCEYPSLPIGGANSHPQVLSTGGVDVTGERVGYSSQGPGRLTERKPDLCAYTHFDGSKVYPGSPDSGTSAACPVVAGVVAAIRTMVTATALTPAQLRTVLWRTADDRSTVGYDYDYGYGVIDVDGLLLALEGRQTQ